jgi:serine/threonine protein kinase
MDELRRFFSDLEIPEINIDEYIISLSKAKISTLKDLLVIATAGIINLERLDIRPADIVEILQWKDKSLEQLISSLDFKKEIDDTDDISFIQPIEITYISRLTRKSLVIILREIGHGASGRVSKALYCPNLTFLAIKRIEIENAAHRVVVGQELKALYEIARCKSIGPPSTTISDMSQSSDKETHLNLLSGEPYSEIIGGVSPIEKLPLGPEAVIKAANNPYLINFYDAYIDPVHGAVCLILEYMNCGSIQSMLNDGLIFDEDDAAVLAFSVLTALTDLHSRNILHRDIKPSNILTDTSGRIKLTDFGITKGMPYY